MSVALFIFAALLFVACVLAAYRAGRNESRWEEYSQGFKDGQASIVTFTAISRAINEYSRN